MDPEGDLHYLSIVLHNKMNLRSFNKPEIMDNKSTAQTGSMIKLSCERLP